MSFSAPFCGLRGLIGAALLAASLCAQAVTAVTYVFAGMVDSDDANRGYSNFSGSFVFDADVLDGIPDTSTAAYAHTGNPWGITLSLDGGLPFTMNAPFNVLVSNNLLGADQWGLLGQQGSDSISLTLTDLQGTVFASDALPLPPGGLTLAPFDITTLQWESSGAMLSGQLTSLSLLTPVPEPGALMLMLAGLGAVGGAARSRRGKAAPNA